MISLSDALRLSLISPSGIRLAFAGSGGKTTTMFRLARELSKDPGSPVLVTASTHLGCWQLPLADVHIEIEGAGEVFGQSGRVRGVTLLTGQNVVSAPAGLSSERQRVKGLDSLALAEVLELAERLGCPLLVEADGSRQLPLKAPAKHEPVIPDWARQVVVMAGLSALGKALDGERVHRFEHYAALSGSPVGSEISVDMVARVLLHPQGGLKAIPPGARRMALLTQSGNQDGQAALDLAEKLLVGFESVLVAASDPRGNIQAVFEPAAGIILAAGSASRFGGPKILVDWHGKPLIRHIAEIALRSGLAQVIVVTGAFHESTVNALEGLPVTFALNPDWMAGQSTSLKTGIQALSARAGSVLFMLADQPFVTPELLRALCLEHTHSLAPVIAPRVNEQRANPVMFDRALFSDLMQLTGDQGGRALFQRYPPHWLPWHDERLLLDLDTPEDYAILKKISERALDD